MSTMADANVKPPFDKELIAIAQYALKEKIHSEEAFTTARYCLIIGRAHV